MSQTKAQLVGGVGISTAENLVVVGVTTLGNVSAGVITATTVNVGTGVTITTTEIKVGDVTIGSSGITGSGSTVTSASVAYNLQGNPIINVSGINNTGVTTSSDTRISSISEKTTIISGNIVDLTYNTGGGNIAICTNPSGNITLNVTGIPTDSSFDNNSISFSVLIQNTGTARSCTAINLNGFSETIRWYGGSLASAIVGVTTTNGFDIYSFVGLNTVGSASTTSNYVVLGSVNGGYR